MVVYLALGSNLGDREANLRSAVHALQRRGVTPSRLSSFYHTEPKELLNQPWFLNGVMEASTCLQPRRLLEVCREVEHEHGRIRTYSNAPRTLDIDIIFYDGLIVDTPELTIPHPRYANRRFVLEPLAEIAPDLPDPRTGLTIRELLAATTDTAIVRAAGPISLQ
jgi:2-amino-4-hydroxy-6-hydroxymethyldihydropteridine diphosphokinase